jgi:hypothetical protein
MNTEQPGAQLLHLLERILTIFGAVTCVAITAVLWRNVSAYQGMWPLPALYFIEVATLSLLSAYLALRGAALAGSFMWGTSGVLGAFCFLGMFSVGVIYLPIFLAFVIASVMPDMRDKKHLAEHLMLCLLAGLAQAALMLAVARWLSTVGF